MDYLTDEQRQFDELIKQINEDAVFFKKPERIFKRLLQFNNGSDGTILVNTDNRIITFGNGDQGFTILDADYVEDRQDFHTNIDMFNQFYQKEKAAATKFINYLNSLELPVASEVMPPQPEEFVEVMIEPEPYSQAWLRNANNATWEIEWTVEHEQDSESNLRQDLYRTKSGEFILHEVYGSGEREVMQRNLPLEAVRTFVTERYSDYEDILASMDIEAEEVEISQIVPMPVSRQEQLIAKVEQEHAEFQEGMKQNSKDEMMSTVNAYEIMVKNEILHHVAEGHIDDELVKVLLESEDILDDLYQAYTAKDSNEFFEPLQAAIHDHVAEYHKASGEPTLNPEMIEPIARMVRSSTELPTNHTHDLVIEEKLDQHELEANKRSFVDRIIVVDEPENEIDLENMKHNEIDLEAQYVEVQDASDGFVAAEELDADGVGNMKKHKARTSIKDFGYKGLE